MRGILRLSIEVMNKRDNKMRTFSRKLAAVFVLVMLSFSPSAIMADDLQPQITLSGEGIAQVTPDMARITLGVVQEAENAADAMDAMSEAMHGILAQLTEAGVEPAHIQTGNLRLDQRYDDFNGGQRKPVGYSAYADVQVQVFDLEKLGAILDAAVRDGANQMNGLQFDVADRAPHLMAARKAAVADARAKAEVYSQAAGVSLGAILVISESGVGAGPMPMMAEASFDSASRSVPISAGEMSISANITIRWALGE